MLLPYVKLTSQGGVAHHMMPDDIANLPVAIFATVYTVS